MARVVALLPDLLFGSKVQGMLAAAGHDVTVVGSPAAALEQLGGSDLLVADLCEDAQDRIALLAAAAGTTKLLAFYLHTDVETRVRALDAGFDLVVPRSRMAREGAALADGLLAPAHDPQPTSAPSPSGRSSSA
jgi:nucleoside-diphosphate-sugar epimerase